MDIGKSRGVRPHELIYSVDERPPFGALLMLGLQHVSILSVSLLIPLLVAKAAGVSAHTLPNLLSFSMIALAIATLLQAYGGKGGGAGYLIPGFCSSNYLSASVSAAQAGGLPLVYGMTLVAGLFETALSRMLIRLRPYFPPEISGLAVAIIGFELGVIAVRNILAIEHPDTRSGLGIAIGFGTFALSFLLSIYGTGKVRLFCALIGVAVGYAAALLAGLMPERSLVLLQQARLLDLPEVDHIGFAFDPFYLIPFLLAAVSAALKTIGAVTTCQKINDSAWSRPDMGEIQRGVAADGLSSVLAALMGTTGQNSSTSNIGVSSATGATSRWIALPIAAWLAVMACSPKLATVFVIMPEAVIGGSLMFAACFMLVNGLQIITSRMLDSRRTAVVGVSLILAVSRYAFPEFFRDLPHAAQPFVGSALSIGVFVAIVMNLGLRIGVHKRETITHRIGEDPIGNLYAFMEKYGATWGARPQVVHRATHSLIELFETVIEYSRRGEPVTVTATFDEFSLDLDVRYNGRAMKIPESIPTPEEMLDNIDLALELGPVLILKLADRVKTSSNGSEDHVVKLHFQH